MIELRLSTIEFTDWGAVTYFHDGTSYGAHPHETPHYFVAAHRCGYEDDVLRYCQEHEVCHLVVEEWLHDRPSRILWGLAHGKPVSAFDAVYEEFAAQALQRFIRANERPMIGGVDWDALRKYAEKKLNGFPSCRLSL